MKFTESHEWIRVENGVGTVGVTQFAQKELGEIVYIELPKVGKQVRAGDEAAVLESTKAAADIYSPVSGEILAVNMALKEASEAINHSAESDGWIFKIKLSAPQELDALMSRDQYQQSIQHH